MFIKRIFDIVIALLGLIFLSPLLAIISLLILIKMKRPVLFLHKRVGRGGSDFLLYKFRTMEDLPEAREGRFDAGSKSRVTPVGKVLRKYKVDELPQLLNVLKGDMSFVGPRPEVRKWTEVHTDKWDIVLKVKPGITDKASIQFRNEEDILAQSTNPDLTYKEVILPQKLDINISYVNNRSFFMDLDIILNTLLAIVRK